MYCEDMGRPVGYATMAGRAGLEGVGGAELYPSPRPDGPWKPPERGRDTDAGARYNRGFTPPE